MITFYGISHSTPLIPLYTTRPTLPHLSRYIALIPFYPTDPTLFHLSHSTSPIPLYPVSHSTPLSNSSQLIQLYSTYPIYPNTSCYYFTHITLNSNRSTLPHPFRSIQPILVYFTHPNLPHPIYKREQKLKTRTKITNAKKITNTKKIRTPSVTTSTRYTNCSGDGDGDGDIHPSRSTSLIPLNHTRPARPNHPF